MTPSGAPTVTGWVQFRVRAASLTRTKGRAVPPRCAVMSRTARLPLLPSMYEKKLDFSFLFIYLFSIIYLLIFFLLTYLVYLFLDCLFQDVLSISLLPLPLSLLRASSLCVVVMQYKCLVILVNLSWMWPLPLFDHTCGRLSAGSKGVLEWNIWEG